MINWNKPILIDGVPETFKLAGTLNDKQLVILTSGPQGAQTLFMVYADGSSIVFDPYPHRPDGRAGPKFENEPELLTMSPTCFMSIYEDGTWRCDLSREAADLSNCKSSRRVACLKVVLTVNPKTGEFDSGVIGKA